MKEYKETFDCACHSHSIQVEYMADPEEITYITLWYMGKQNCPHILDRIRAAWQMLTSGYANDDILLNKEKTTKLRDALSIILDEGAPK
jgi:esterase/lipase superfamily enzyme